MVVPPVLVGLVGRGFIWIVRRFPAVFLLCCAAGLAVGVAALFCFGEKPPSAAKPFMIRLIGVGCIGFYGWLAFLCCSKLRHGAWNDFCDWAFEIFADM